MTVAEKAFKVITAHRVLMDSNRRIQSLQTWGHSGAFIAEFAVTDMTIVQALADAGLLREEEVEPPTVEVPKAWYDPLAEPRFVGCEHYCRDGNCPDTNWGGRDRVHQRYNKCPDVKRQRDPMCPVCVALEAARDA